MSFKEIDVNEGKEVKPKNQILQTPESRENDKKKLTPCQEFKKGYEVPEEKLNKSESNKLSKPNESDNRPGQRGGNGKDRGFEYER